MPKIPGVNHRNAVRALQKSGFNIVREGRKHTVMSDGVHFVTIPGNSPINACTMAGIVKDSRLTVEGFKKRPK